ncbi:DUF2914 domain-containing protein [Aliiglaciecola sp. CAU 1673]|uniref:DUF2914 domain-containing protein n=1 Tax=Aliiglaciecola sp. CAU 1673 TaxID=3032595 RepID=UPI0023DB2AEA|nr:DUF2914 domain-containing protein [Aliiglaciecola sp. CAU 1673]MDF2177964.1 DUF2914 domain-containing protein [Aliiglaciecola sp. CAU 1673]
MKALILALLILGFVAPGQADVLRSQLTSAVVAREPVDDLRGEVIGKPNEITQVVFFTQLDDMQGQDVVHKWFYQGELMAEVPMSVRSPNWRTWSSKRLLPAWQGNWQVQLWSGDKLLLSKEFRFTLASADYQ